MRAALVNAWPALAEYGIYPWNVNDLAEVELASYLDAIRQRTEAIKKQRRDANRRSRRR